MSIDLPGAIAAYFEADKQKSAQDVVACFTAGAVVEDEGIAYRGPDSICRWKTESSSKYTYSVEPFSVRHEGRRTLVIAHLTGDFPGSPTDLRYAFEIEGDKISALEIRA